MPNKLTLKRIAKELNVSISTVSKALRDSHEISEETRERIKAFAKDHNYRPNNIALSLKNRKTRTIAIIIPEIVHHFFATVINGVETEANAHGYNVIVCMSNESFDKEVINMETLANGSIDGFIISVSKETLQKQDYHHLREVVNQGMPIVMFDRVAEDIPSDKIVIDDVAASRRATNFLLDNGVKNPVILSTVDYVTVGRLRTQGFKEALRNRDVEGHDDDSRILRVEDMERAEAQVKYFLKHRDCDGIIAVNELFAVTASKYLQSMGKEIPKDVQIITFTDGILSQYASPTLSAIQQHGDDMGKRAAGMLIERLEKDEDVEEYRTMILETSLIERESTR